jgi:hypothetical protein
MAQQARGELLKLSHLLRGPSGLAAGSRAHLDACAATSAAAGVSVSSQQQLQQHAQPRLPLGSARRPISSAAGPWRLGHNSSSNPTQQQQTRSFFSSGRGSSGSATSSSSGSGPAVAGVTAESIGQAISAAFGFGGGGSGGGSSGGSSGGGGGSSGGGAGKSDAASTAGWAARMRFRRQEPTFQVRRHA